MLHNARERLSDDAFSDMSNIFLGKAKSRTPITETDKHYIIQKIVNSFAYNKEVSVRTGCSGTSGGEVLGK